MKREKPGYYAIIPNDVRYDKDLTANEKLLYGEINALSNRDNYCWASNSYFSSLYDVAPESVSRWIRHLKEKGYINVNYDSFKRTININNSVNESLTRKLNTHNNNVKYNDKNNNINEIFEEVRIKNDF